MGSITMSAAEVAIPVHVPISEETTAEAGSHRRTSMQMGLGS